MKLTDFLKSRGLLGTGTSTDFLNGATTPAFATPAGGGGSGDMLSTLTSAEIAVTGAVTATISRMHVCTGTSADYTVTLPAASGNAGKFLGFRMAGVAALSKLVTLDGNASETIDGSLTRIMWAGEACVLLCDGSNWFKVSGKTLPMYATLKRTTTQSISVATWTAVLMTAQDSGTTQMYDSGNSRVKIARPGVYRATGMAYLTQTGANSNVLGGYIGISPNAVSPPGAAAGLPADASGGVQGYGMMQDASLALADYINLSAYASGSSGAAVAANTNPSYISVSEIPTW